MKKIIRICNLHCANCAREMEEELLELSGITSCSVDFINQRVTLDCEEEALKRAIHLIAHFEEVKIIDGNAPQKGESRLKEVLSIVISLLFFLPALIIQLVGGYPWVSFSLFLCAFLAAGWSVLVTVGKNFAKAFREGFRISTFLDENLLMVIASVGAFAIGENMEGAIVMLLYQLGELLQSVAVGSSRNAISRLAQLQSDSAIVLREGVQHTVSPEDLCVGDTLLIRRGDKIPVDCTLSKGRTQLDTKSLTGEAYLREVDEGDELLAGCVNEGDFVEATVLRPFSESAVSKILSLVEGATAQKAKPEKFITKFARIYTPVVVLLALVLAFIPPVFEGYTWSAFTRWLISALNFLVISCPCALIISVPLTYFSGVGALAKMGVLAKGAVYLDTLASVRIAAFDKTGTLTEGKFHVVKTHGAAQTLPLAAAIERHSSHPLAQAFAEVKSEYSVTSVKELSGMGLCAQEGADEVLVGSYRLMCERGIVCEEIRTEHSVVYVARAGQLVGAVEIGDRVKGDSKDAISALKGLGIRKTVVLTGDSEQRAKNAVEGLGVDEVHAELLPEQKSELASALKGEGTLLYVGDGINDTPVMALSDLSVAMGGLGSDAAIEASDMVLVSDNLNALPKAIRAARKTRKIVLENIVFSIAVKAVLMALSVVGMLPLWAAVLGDVGVMLLAVLNAMRMRAKIK